MENSKTKTNENKFEIIKSKLEEIENNKLKLNKEYDDLVRNYNKRKEEINELLIENIHEKTNTILDIERKYGYSTEETIEILKSLGV